MYTLLLYQKNAEKSRGFCIFVIVCTEKSEKIKEIVDKEEYLLTIVCGYDIMNKNQTDGGQQNENQCGNQACRL